MFLFAPARRGARQRRKLQVDQFVDHGEFHIVQHCAACKLVFGGAEDANYRGFLACIPVHVSQGLGPQIAGLRHYNRYRPILEFEALLPKRQPSVNEALGLGGTLLGSRIRETRLQYGITGKQKRGKTQKTRKEPADHYRYTTATLPSDVHLRTSRTGHRVVFRVRFATCTRQTPHPTRLARKVPAWECALLACASTLAFRGERSAAYWSTPLAPLRLKRQPAPPQLPPFHSASRFPGEDVETGCGWKPEGGGCTERQQQQSRPGQGSERSAHYSYGEGRWHDRNSVTLGAVPRRQPPHRGRPAFCGGGRNLLSRHRVVSLRGKSQGRSDSLHFVQNPQE